MKRFVGILILVGAVATGVCWSVSHAAEEPLIVEETAFDAAKPETWAPAIARVDDSEGEIVKALIAVAQDEKRTADERRKAVLLLGRIGDRESLEFLALNVSMHIPTQERDSDNDVLLQMPCLYALCEEGGWYGAQAILASLDKPRLETELMDLVYSLKRILYQDVALAVVEMQLLQHRRDEARRTNLEVLKRFLQN